MSRPRPTRSTDALLTLLADRRRRAVVRHLSARNGRTSLGALVEAVSTERGDERNVRIGLHHHHLPRLDAADVVDYDVSARTVRYRPDERVESLLAFVAGELEEFEGAGEPERSED